MVRRSPKNHRYLLAFYSDTTNLNTESRVLPRPSVSITMVSHPRFTNRNSGHRHKLKDSDGLPP